jgi:2-hydroxy-3-keto-5-methylthiopentenyl-1-phosphate phosphatase
LAKGNIQENSFIPDLGMKKSDFWDEVKQLTKENEMDEILAYMFLLISKAKTHGGIKFDRKSLTAHGKDVSYFDGVEEFFDRINEYARQKHIKLEHYIISSGTKEMIEGTSIKKHFKTIYASSFKYDQNDVPEWPAIAVNYTTKTQFLFRINKGINNAWDNAKINTYVPKEKRPVPFERMIYIGDGLTDVPAMKLVKDQGGTSIGVYAPKSRKKSAVQKLLTEKRVSYVAPANYSDGSELDQIIKATIDQASSISSVLKYASKPAKTRSETKPQDPCHEDSND